MIDGKDGGIDALANIEFLSIFFGEKEG